MRAIRCICIVLSLMAVACEVSERDAPGDGDTAETVSAVTGGCTVVQTPPLQTNNPLFQISPKSTIASDFTRPVFPLLAKSGSWSTPQYVVDLNGLALPSVVASGANVGILNLPFNSGDTIVGVTMTVCGDAVTYIIGNVIASQFSIPMPPPNPPFENLTDALVGIGSTISAGPGAVWHDVDIGMQPVTLADQSQLWIQLQAQAGSQGAPISMAVGRVLLHLNH